MTKENEPWGKLNFSLVGELGEAAAVLYVLLANYSKSRKKDKDGFFELETVQIYRKFKWSRWKIIRIRNILEESGLISFRQGLNQNVKNRYRIN